MRPTRYPRRGTDAVHSALAQTRKAALRLRSFQRMRTRMWLPVQTHTEPTVEQTQVASTQSTEVKKRCMLGGGSLAGQGHWFLVYHEEVGETGCLERLGGSGRREIEAQGHLYIL